MTKKEFKKYTIKKRNQVMDTTQIALLIGAIVVVGVVVYYMMQGNSNSGSGSGDNGGDKVEDDAEEDGSDPEDLEDENQLFASDGILFFGTEGCPACRGFSPVFVEASRRTRYPFRYFNLKRLRDRAILARHNIQRIPHVVGVRGGKIVATFDGPRTPVNLRRFARRVRAMK